MNQIPFNMQIQVEVSYKKVVINLKRNGTTYINPPSKKDFRLISVITRLRWYKTTNDDKKKMIQWLTVKNKTITPFNQGFII